MHKGILPSICVSAIMLAGGAQAEAPKPSTVPPAMAGENHVDAPLWTVTAHPGNGHGAYATGHYRNLFVERLGHTPAEAHAKVEAAFNQLFHGDGQEERVYFETGANANGTLAYITDWANNDVRTEGMSYGMMIAVQLNKKREFDALWNWSKTYMQTTDPKSPEYGYFAWSMNTDGTPRATGAAPDGEEYYVMALMFAAHRWGNGKGIYNYQAEADKILKGMRHHATVTAMTPFRVHPDGQPVLNPDKPWPSPNNRAQEAAARAAGKPWPPFHFDNTPRAVTVGPMVDEAHYMVRFVPETNVPGTDASYHLPGFYELWARWGPVEDRAFWQKAADVSRDFFPKVVGAKTGLSPDRSHFDGSTLAGWDGQSVPFSYDSWRTVSNWSFDFNWWGKDPRETELADRVQAFLNSEGIDKFADRYTLDGKPLSDRHSPGMVAAAAVGSLAATPGPVSDGFVKALWDMPVPSGEQRYFDGMLYLFSLLHVSGEYRVIEARGK